jgi:carboxypeptidase PM20D1
MLLASGFQPRQTVYIVSGADEEVAACAARAHRQAAAAAQGAAGLRHRRGPGAHRRHHPRRVRAGVPDRRGREGLRHRAAEGVDTPGHASMPPPPGTTAIAKMGAALAPAGPGAVPGEAQGRGARAVRDAGARDAWLPARGAVQPVAVRPAGAAQLAKGASTNAMLRTTTALTIVNAGNKDNVIPGQAQATSTSASCPATRARRCCSTCATRSAPASSSRPSPAAPIRPDHVHRFAVVPADAAHLALAVPGHAGRAGALRRRLGLAALRADRRPPSTVSRRCAPSPRTCPACTAPTNASPSPTSASWCASTTSCCATSTRRRPDRPP